MRLREIQQQLLVSRDDLVLAGEQIPNASPAQYRLLGILKANQAVHILEHTGLFNSLIGELRSSSFYNSPVDSIKVNAQEYSTIIKNINRIKEDVTLLLDSFEIALGSHELVSDKTISVKIKKLKNLDELLEIVDKLKKVIQLPLSEYSEGGEVKIENFDSGSFWFDFLLPSAAGVTLIGTIAWAGAVIYKKYLEAFAFRSYAEGLEIQKDHLENLKEAAKKKIDLDIEAEATLIQNNFLNPNDVEQLARLKLSIKEYSKLIQKGVEIQPALTAPEKVTNLFPNYKALELLESKVKQIQN